MKKGIFFTLGITILVITVFSLAVLLFHDVQSTENRFSELALFDRVSDFDGMIQNNIRDINYYESGLGITVYNDSVVFTESFPRSARFADVMTDYKNYIEEIYNSSPKITFDETKLSQIKNNQLMYIMPYNILYEHDSGFTQESYKLEPNSNDVLGYNISLDLNAASAEPFMLMDTGSFPATIKLTFYGESPQTFEWNINPNSVNTVKINLLDNEGAGIGDIDIQAGSNSYYAYLEVDGERTISSTLKVLLEEPLNELIEIKYSEDLFTIHFEESELIKKGTVKLV